MVRRAKKPRDRNVKARRRISAEAINYMTTLTESILRAEFGFDNADMEKFTSAMNRYSEYVCDSRTGISFNFLKDYNKKENENDEREHDGAAGAGQ